MKKTILSLLLLCVTVSAQGSRDISDPIVNIICGLFNAFKVIGAGLGSLIFVYAGVKYLTEVDDPGARKRAKDMMQTVVIGILIVVLVDFIIAWVVVSGGAGLQQCSFWCSYLPC